MLTHCHFSYIQDAEFYDNPNHSTGTLVADLASHSAAIQGVCIQ